MERAPTAAGQLLIALDMWLGPMQEWVLIGGPNDGENGELLAAVQRAYAPNCVLAYRPRNSTQGADAPRSPLNSSPMLEPLFAGRTAIDNQPTLFVCESFTCQSPIVGRAAIEAWLTSAR
jgi:uncharacterized protein YyaL (SSP411 family)